MLVPQVVFDSDEQMLSLITAFVLSLMTAQFVRAEEEARIALSSIRNR